MPHEIVGEKFGRWEVVEVRGRKALCRCECGVEREVAINNMLRGISKSCGCLKSELNSRRCRLIEDVTIREMPLYGVWATMKSRCYNPNFPKYKRYGARGIKVCDRWKDSFVAFLEDMGQPPRGCTLERKDNDGDYCPENCRWATPKEQGRNQSTNRIGYVNGQEMCVAEASDRFGVKYRTIISRMNRGLTMEQAVFYEPDAAKVGVLR